VFCGTAMDLLDVIHFERRTAKELVEPFRYRIHYRLALCAERGEAPDRPLNSTILLRAAPELHRKAVLSATAEGISLSQQISRKIELVQG